MTLIQMADDHSIGFDLDDNIGTHRLSIVRASVKFFELNC